MVNQDGELDLSIGKFSADAQSELFHYTSVENNFVLVSGASNPVAGNNPRRVAITFGLTAGSGALLTTQLPNTGNSGIQLIIGQPITFNFQNNGTLPGKAWTVWSPGAGLKLCVIETLFIG